MKDQLTTQPTLEMLDPGTLTVDVNVRKDAALTPEFVASVKEHGVIEPVIGHRVEDGTVHVLMGQRRTCAAVEAGTALIPVMIVTGPEEAERITAQVVENVQRSALTDADEADAFHQLSLLGVTAAQIAKKTGRAKTTVEGALKAKQSATGQDALAKGRTIDQALVLAEFEDDADATEDLESVLDDEPDMLDHVAQQLRDDRARKQARAALVAELEAAGTPVVESYDYGHNQSDENVSVSALNRPDGERATAEDANAVYIRTDAWREAETVPVVTGWKALGFTLRYAYESSAPKGPMNDEQKAERKTLIANNKAMESATVVRREFVRSLLAKKQAPKGWQYFTIHALTHHSEVASGYEPAVAAEMAGAKIEGTDTWGWNPLRDHVAKTTTRPEVPTIALICAGYEKTIVKDSWRSPGASHVSYLTQLVTWGYTTSEVEQIILDSTNPPADDEEEAKDVSTTESAEDGGESFTFYHGVEKEMTAEEQMAAE